MLSIWKVLPFAVAAALVPIGTSAAVPKKIELVLMLRERVPVEALAKNVLDPNSIRYEEFYTPAEIREISAPTDADYNALITHLKSRGIEIISESPSHLVLTVLGATPIVENVFNTKIVDAGGGRIKPRNSTTVPQSLSLIASVSGFDTTRRSHPKFAMRSELITMDGNDPYGGMTPDVMKKLYSFDAITKAGYTGKGQHIAIAGYDAYDPTDVAIYRSSMIDHPGAEPDEIFFNGHPGPNPDSAAENDLDAEFSGMVAPEAAIHLFLSEHNDDPGEVQLFTAIMDDNRAKIANYSWGDCETKVSAAHRADMDKVFARAVAQGVTVVVAAGDWGSEGCPDNDKTSADWPGAHPDVMAVGGTSIWQSDCSNKITEEVWEGTGGGFSAFYAAPVWQASASTNKMRGFPDVSFDGDPNTGESAYLSYPAIPKWITVGGTSIGAPQWSGIIALLNESRGPKGPIGFLPPHLYGLSAAQRATSFRDIVKGKNGAYSAGSGWDPTTGFGSPLASALLSQLIEL